MGQMAHLPNFSGMPEKCELVALADRRQELASRVAERYGIPRVYPSHKEVAKDREVEAVVSITGDAVNPAVSMDLLRAGKHVLIEKPMAAASADAENMALASEANGKWLMVAFMKRFDPGVELAKRRIDDYIASGKLGRITYARACCFGGDWWCGLDNPLRSQESAPQIQSDYPEWLPADSRTEYSIFNNLYSHNLNLLRFLLGDLRVESAKVGAPTRVAVMDGGGFPVTLEGGQLSANHWHEQTVVYFQHGRIEINTPSPMLRNVPAQVEIYEAGKYQTVQRPQAEWDWSFRREDEHFLDCVLENREPLTSARDSKRDVELMEEIFRKGIGSSRA